MVEPMPAVAEWIPWMPSPSIIPDEPSLDRQHLSRMTLGELALEREVLALFAAQAQDIVTRLAATPADAGTLAHTLKGASSSVGAFRLAEAAKAYETDLRADADMALAFEALSAEVVRARAAIDAILKRS